MNTIVKEVATENGDLLTLTYEVIEEQTSPQYGLRLKAERHSPVESVEIPNITANLLEIKRLLMVLSTCSVTPTTVHEILRDFAVEAHFREK